MDFTVQVPDLDDLLLDLDAVARDQIPFATAVSLRRIGLAALDRQRTELAKRFTLRNRGIPRGFNMQPQRPSKKDWPNLFVEVGAKPGFEFFKLHETGGQKTAAGGGRVAIPTRFVHTDRTTRGAIRARLRPGGLQQARVHDARLVARPLPSKPRLSIFYLLRQRAEIKPRLGLRETVTSEVGGTYRDVFIRELTAAVASRRVRGQSLTSEHARLLYLRKRYRLEGIIHR